MGACFEKHHLAIITEYMVNGTLHSVLHNQKIQLDWNQRIVMLKDICGGMGQSSFFLFFFLFFFLPLNFKYKF